jgi:hypothetical protein
MRSLLAILLTLCAVNIHAQPPVPAPAAELKALLDDDLEASRRRFPFGPTIRGIPGYDHLLPEVSLAALDKERARERRALERLKALDAGASGPGPPLLRALPRQDGARASRPSNSRTPMPLFLSTLGGLHNVMPRMAQLTPFRKAETIATT